MLRRVSNACNASIFQFIIDFVEFAFARFVGIHKFTIKTLDDNEKGRKIKEDAINVLLYVWFYPFSMLLSMTLTLSPGLNT